MYPVVQTREVLFVGSGTREFGPEAQTCSLWAYGKQKSVYSPIQLALVGCATILCTKFSHFLFLLTVGYSAGLSNRAMMDVVRTVTLKKPPFEELCKFSTSTSSLTVVLLAPA